MTAMSIRDCFSCVFQCFTTCTLCTQCCVGLARTLWYFLAATVDFLRVCLNGITCGVCGAAAAAQIVARDDMEEEKRAERYADRYEEEESDAAAERPPLLLRMDRPAGEYV